MSTIVSSKPSDAINGQLRLHAIFRQGNYLSMKHDSYFQVYERVFSRFVGQAITFVEVGVLNGGSLFMWRDFFGPQARIIGIDLNPEAKRWESHGFEIHIGSQSDPAFWTAFFEKVGDIDVLLDDGGHTNRQQIVTVSQALDRVRPGGVIVVEDTHASYMPEFGNPSRRSFINYCKRAIDSVGSRSGVLAPTSDAMAARVFSLEFYESIIVFNIDPSRCFVSSIELNGGESMNARDFRPEAVNPRVLRVDRALSVLNRIVVLKSIKKRVIKLMHSVGKSFDDVGMGRYFK
jgi:hypothetical protein